MSARKDLWEIGETKHQSCQPYEELCIAVISQACRDYRKALRKKKQNPYQQYEVDDCEKFFRDELSLYSDLDGEWLIELVRKSVEND